MQAETKFKIEIRPLIDALPKCITFKIQQVGLRGVPDFLCCLNGWFVALELKRSRRAKVQDLQLYYLTRITNAGGFGILVYPENWEQVYKFLLMIGTTDDTRTSRSGKENPFTTSFQSLEGAIFHHGIEETSHKPNP
jgi:hypothetical protein